MAGTWASRLGVHVWEPRVMRASVPDRGRTVGMSLSTAPSPQMLGADLGHVCTHVYMCGCAHGGMDLCVHAYE